MCLLCFGDHGARPPLLTHAIKVMQRARSLAQRMRIRNRRRNIRFREKNRLGESAPMRQVTSQRRGECTSGAVGGTRALTVRFENFLLRTPAGGKAEEISRLFQMSASDHYIRRSEGVQT